MPPKSDTISVRLPEDLKLEVARLAIATKRSRAHIVKEAVAAYVEDERDYQAAIDEALREADEGVFVSGEAAIAWLKSIGTAHEKPIPEPDVFLKKQT